MYTETINRLSPYLILMIIVSFTFTSCLDDAGYINSFSVATIHETQNIPDIEEADAILMAIRKVALVEQSGFDVVKTIGEANALFFGEKSIPTLTSAGNVLVNGNYLFLTNDNKYSFSVDLTNEQGYIFNTEVVWDITGDNQFRPVVGKKLKIWPDVGPVNSPKTIKYGLEYELSIEYLKDAHATCFQISGIGALLKEYKEDSHLSHTFTASEILQLGRGPGIVQVNAYYINDTIVSGKNLYFMNAEASYEVIEIR